MNTNKLVTMSFAFGLTALAACGGDSTTPSASGVFPAQGFAGRTLRVEISGDATSWKAGATVSFGDGVTVNSVEVASPTDLFAEISIDPSATIGMHDVTVTSGGAFKLNQAFEVDAPVDLAFAGDTVQGSGPAFTLTNHDIENPFDTTSDGQGGFPNIAITGPAGVTFSISMVTEHAITGFALIDVDAGTGGPISVASGPTATQVTSNIGTPMTITARTATPLTSGTAVSGNLKANNTDLYSISASATPTLFEFLTPAPANPNGSPIALLLGPSGHWADAIASNFNPLVGALPSFTQFTPVSGTYYLLYFDAGTQGYAYSLTGTASAFTTVAEGTNGQHTTEATAQTGSALPFLLSPATMSSGDSDWIKFTNGTAGKFIHITMYGNDTQTDLQVETFEGAACTNSLNSTPGTPDPLNSTTDYFSGNPTTGTTFCVQITPGANWNASHTMYGAAIWLE